MIFLVTSDYRKTFVDNVRRAISLPSGVETSFTYDKKYVDTNIISNPDDYVGRNIVIMFQKTDKIDNKTAAQTIVPIRKGIIKKIEIIEDLVRITIALSSEYWYPPKENYEIAKLSREIIEKFLSHKRHNSEKFVFDDELPQDIIFSEKVMPVFDYLVENNILSAFSSGTIETLYKVDLFDAKGNTLKVKNGMVYFQMVPGTLGNIINLRILFHTKKVDPRHRKIITFYISANRVVFPVDFHETDARDEILYFTGIAKPGFDYIKIEVDSGYAIHIPIIIEEKDGS